MPTPLLESPTTDALQAFASRAQQGDRVPLRDLVPGDWDRVHYFPEGTARRAVLDAVGADVTGGAQGRLPQPGPLLVFMRGSVPIEAVYALPPLSLTSDGSVFAPESAMIRARTRGPAPHGLTLE